MSGDLAPALPPGPRLPPAAQRLAWAQRPFGFTAACRRAHGDVFTVRFGRGLTLVVVGEPALARQLLAEGPDVMRRGAAPGRLRTLGEHSVIVRDGADHAQGRAALRPALDAAVIEAHRDVVRALTLETLAALPTGAPVALLPHLRRLTDDLLLAIVFGARQEHERAPLRAAFSELLASAHRSIPSIPVVRRRWGPGIPSGRNRAALAALDRLVLEAIAARAAEPQARREHRTDLLTLLLATTSAGGQPPSAQELRDHLVTLVLAGRDNLFSALAWSFERLVRQPAILARIAEDATRDSPAYAEAAVREVLRLRPPSWFTGARIPLGPYRLGPHTIPAGTLITAFTALVHHHPAAFPEPEALRPERFLDGPPSGDWIPFGGGHRRCAAEQLAILAAAAAVGAAAGRYELTPPTSADELQREIGVIFLPARGAQVVLTPKS